MSATTGQPKHLPGPQREIERTLRDANDAHVVRVVAMLDVLPDRDMANALIAPMRTRLAGLRPPRPINFSRLLFTPLDAVIVQARFWRRDSLGVPRTAIMPMVAEVRRELGGELAAIDAMLRSSAGQPPGAIADLGGILWPKAAAILEQGRMGPEWRAATGLGTADHGVLARACAVVLRVAPDLDAIASHAAHGGVLDTAALARAVMAAATPLETGMLLAVAMTRFPAAHNLAAAMGDAAGGHLDPKARAAVDSAIDFMLMSIDEGTTSSLDLAEAAKETARIAGLLASLEQPGPSFRPSRKARAEALRRKVDQQQRGRFTAEIAKRVVGAAARLAATASDADIEELEASMRDLRRFEGAGRQLGGAEHYDRELKAAAAGVRDLPLPAADRLRLVEMMIGAEAALRLMPDAA